MSSPISLIHMPNLVMKHIFEYLEFPSILILRKVCHDFRNFIEDSKPASHLTKILVNVKPESIDFKLYFSWTLIPINIDYMKNGEGCLVKWNKGGKFKETMMEKEDFVAVFCNDFDIIVRHQKTLLKALHFNFDGSNLTDKKRILESVNKSLKSLNRPLSVKSLYLTVNNQDDILTILPYIDPKPLEKIYISGFSERDNVVVLNLDEIGQLEQWKQAERLEILQFQVPDLFQNVKHFSKITLRFLNIPAEKIILLKELFFCSSTLNTIDIFANYHIDSVVGQELIEAFGEPYLNSYWFFSIPDTNQFLIIKLRSNNIYFYRTDQSRVPQNARISN